MKCCPNLESKIKPRVLVKIATAMTRQAVGAKLGLREISIHLCQRSPGCQGVRDFIQKCCVELRKANAGLPILIQECSYVQPKLWAHYAFGQEKNVSLNNFSADQVTRVLENVLSAKLEVSTEVYGQEPQSLSSIVLNTMWKNVFPVSYKACAVKF
uniref:NADH dehydrogenase [ubiquinone] 1 alpha subcomplex subunit 2 n=1 Tax=Sciurus vulgaris TaxID=55149 RepID=A0A8D2B6C7_SCIVU